MRLVPGMAENIMRIEDETEVPPFGTVAPFPSIAEEIVVSGGTGGIVLVAMTRLVDPDITETEVAGAVCSLLETYAFPLKGLKAIPLENEPNGIVAIT